MVDRSWISARLQGGGQATERGDHEFNPGFRPKGELKAAAVLVGLVAHDDAFTVLLTRRTEHLEHHPGQISFPGGHLEPGDLSAEDAALRETLEETGLAPERIEVVGRLDTYVTRTGFSITPVVGIITPPLKLNIDAHEVAEVFEVPLAHFLEPENHQRLERSYQGTKRGFYAMPYEDYYIWGATAGMLRNLYQVLSD